MPKGKKYRPLDDIFFFRMGVRFERIWVGWRSDDYVEISRARQMNKKKER